ncbi:fumarate hydratase, class II [Burkholderia pseudomallei 576]|nr:fumarate hydratase, class II [Burkholderia pseudomallei 576]
MTTVDSPRDANGPPRFAASGFATPRRPAAPMTPMTPATPTKRPPPSHIEHARSQRRPDEKRSPRHVSMLAPAAIAPLVALRMRAARSPISAPPRRPSHAARHEIARGAMLAHQWMPSRERLRPRMRIAPRPRGVPRHLKEQS